MKVEVLRVNGTSEEHEVDVGDFFQWCALDEAIDAAVTDSINLRDGRVMIVDDLGYETEQIVHETHIENRAMEARKPVNRAATLLYWSVCKPGTTHQIVGDVAIVLDSEFA